MGEGSAILIGVLLGVWIPYFVFHTNGYVSLVLTAVILIFAAGISAGSAK